MLKLDFKIVKESFLWESEQVVLEQESLLSSKDNKVVRILAKAHQHQSTKIFIIKIHFKIKIL